MGVGVGGSSSASSSKKVDDACDNSILKDTNEQHMYNEIDTCRRNA